MILTRMRGGILDSYYTITEGKSNYFSGKKVLTNGSFFRKNNSPAACFFQNCNSKKRKGV